MLDDSYRRWPLNVRKCCSPKNQRNQRFSFFILRRRLTIRRLGRTATSCRRGRASTRTTTRPRPRSPQTPRSAKRTWRSKFSTSKLAWVRWKSEPSLAIAPPHRYLKDYSFTPTQIPWSLTKVFLLIRVFEFMKREGGVEFPVSSKLQIFSVPFPTTQFSTI